MTISVVPTSRESRRLTGTVEPPRRTAPREDTPPRVWPVWALKLRQDYEAKLAAAERRIAELEAAMVAARRAQREMNDSALTLYGGSTALQEVTKQVSISPKFASLNAQEHEYVARVALATGLNPEFHIHAWTSSRKDKNGNFIRQLNVTPDYKALIQLSKRNYLMVKERRLTADEMRERGISQRDIEEGAIAYLVEGYELDKAALAKQAGLEYEPLRGFGWWPAMKQEWDNKTRSYKRVPNDVPNGRDGAWVAWKRATRALYNQLADLTFKFNRPADMAADEDGDTWTFETSNAPMIIDADANVREETTAGDDGVPDDGPEVIEGEGELGDAATPAEAEPPASAEPAGQPVRMCTNCGVEPATETPLGSDYCETCASRIADQSRRIPGPVQAPPEPPDAKQQVQQAFTDITWTRNRERVAKMIGAAEQMWAIPRPHAINRVAKALGLDNPQGEYEALFEAIAAYEGSPQDAWKMISAYKSEEETSEDPPLGELCEACGEAPIDPDAPIAGLCTVCANTALDAQADKPARKPARKPAKK